MAYASISGFSTSLILLIIFNAISFLGFGISCIVSDYMVAEFKRYGLPKYRVLNGCLQILASLALLAGFYEKMFAIVASAGLALLMLMGFIVRMRIRDHLMKALPAFCYFMLNVIILIGLINS